MGDERGISNTPTQELARLRYRGYGKRTALSVLRGFMRIFAEIPQKSLVFPDIIWTVFPGGPDGRRRAEEAQRRRGHLLPPEPQEVCRVAGMMDTVSGL